MAFSAGKPTFGERVHDSIGFYKFLYYKYIDRFKKTPYDLDDMVDGLIYIHLLSQKD